MVDLLSLVKGLFVLADDEDRMEDDEEMESVRRMQRVRACVFCLVTRGNRFFLASTHRQRLRRHTRARLITLALPANYHSRQGLRIKRAKHGSLLPSLSIHPLTAESSSPFLPSPGLCNRTRQVASFWQTTPARIRLPRRMRRESKEEEEALAG